MTAERYELMRYAPLGSSHAQGVRLVWASRTYEVYKPVSRPAIRSADDGHSWRSGGGPVTAARTMKIECPCCAYVSWQMSQLGL